jgi:hypothetical protein
MRYIGTFLGFKVYEDPTLKEGEFRVQRDSDLTNEMLALEKHLSAPSAIGTPSDDAECFALVKKHGLVLDTYADGEWLVRGDLWKDINAEARGHDLNAAIRACVEKINV